MLGLRARQILALAGVMVAIALVTMVLEMTGVTRSAVNDARRDARFASRTLVLQIGQVVASRPDLPPLEAIRDAQVLQVSLEAATQFAPSVLYAAFTDSTGHAVLHTDPGQLGQAVVDHPPLPELGGPPAVWAFMWHLFRRGSEIHEEVTPLRIGDRRLGSVRIALSPAFIRRDLSAVVRRGFFLALFYVGVAGVAAYFLTRIVLGPMGEVRRGIEALRAGDFSYRVPQQNIQEFGLMAQALNELGAEFHARELSRGDDEHLRKAVELLGDGLVAVGPDREVTLLNNLAGRYLGLGPEASVGRSLSGLLGPEHPLTRLVEELLSGRNEHISIRAEIAAAGEERALMALGHRVQEETGAVGAVIELKDLSVLRDLQAVMDHSTVLSRLGEMAAGVAHEIRNPLNAITLHLEPLRHAQNLDPDMVREAVEVTRAQIARLDRAVSGFLKVARLRKLAIVPFRPERLVEEVSSLLAPEATMAGLELIPECEGGGPEVTGDPEVLRQALMNVVKNAIQALPSRDRRVRVACAAEDDRVLFTVTDSGPGMSDAVRRRAFDLYMTTKENGTGVGLAFVRQAVEMHGGRVEIESAPGAGTRVVLSLRAKARPPATPASFAAVASPPAPRGTGA